MTAPIQDVSETALMVAAWRALETQRSKPLFRDHLAEKLAGERGREIIASQSKSRSQLGAWMMAIRTRLIDDMIQDTLTEGVDVIVNLGAGLDTRPYRLPLPKELLWIEVDYPKIIDLKDSRLADEKAVCSLERIPCDLADAKARQNLFSVLSSRGKKILVLTEGVIIYLNDKEVGDLANDLRTHPSFQFWIADYFSPFIQAYRKRTSQRFGMKNAPFLFEPQDYFKFFEEHGWRTKHIHFVNDVAQRLKRPPPLFMRVWAILKAPFLSPQARQEMRRAMAYVLFEPKK